MSWLDSPPSWPNQPGGDQPGVEQVVVNLLQPRLVIDKTAPLQTQDAPSMSRDRTDQKPNRKTLLIAVWASLLLFTLFSGSIAG